MESVRQRLRIANKWAISEVLSHTVRGARRQLPGYSKESAQIWLCGEPGAWRGGCNWVNIASTFTTGSNGMPIRNEQLGELLSLTAGSIGQLSEALTTFSFELMASEDPAVRIAGRRMASRVSTIQLLFDQQVKALNCSPAADGSPERVGEPSAER